MFPLVSAPKPSADASSPNITGFNVSPLIESVGAPVSCCSWDSSCSLWAAGTQGGRVHVWEKTGEPGSLGAMRPLASWQAASSPISDLSWGPPTSPTQLAVCCSEASSSTHTQSGASASLPPADSADQLIREGEIGVWGPVSPLFGPASSGSAVKAPGKSPGPQQRAPSLGKLTCDRGTVKWGRRAVLPVGSPGEGDEGQRPSRRVLALRYLRADTEEDPLLLLLAVVTRDGKLLVFCCRDACSAQPQWSLRDEVPLVLGAMVSPGHDNLAAACMAPHPSCASIGSLAAPSRQPRTVSIALALQKQQGPLSAQGGCEAKIWVYSNRFLRWYAVADLAEALLTSGAMTPASVVNDISWCPATKAPSEDILALATSQGTSVLRVSSPAPAPNVLSAPPSFLKVELVPLQGASTQEEVMNLSWHWSGSLLAVANVRGEIYVWKENAQGKWTQQCHVSHALQ